ncbi:unnamed protein product, partial [Candidula unifasciata]
YYSTTSPTITVKYCFITTPMLVCLGSYMVELEDEPELHFIQTLIADSGEQFWVGLDYFLWHTNRHEPTPAMWLPTEPNETGFCVRLATEALTGANARGTTYLLGDHPCTHDYKVICEKNAGTRWYTIVPATNRCRMTPYIARSRLSCARNCSKNQACTGFEFNMGTRVCTRYKFSTSCPTSLSSHVSMYVMLYPRC